MRSIKKDSPSSYSGCVKRSLSMCPVSWIIESRCVIYSCWVSVVEVEVKEGIFWGSKRNRGMKGEGRINWWKSRTLGSLTSGSSSGGGGLLLFLRSVGQFGWS